MATASVDKIAYESLFIVPPETHQKTIDSFIEKIKTTLSKDKGLLKGVQFWGRRRLAYPIKQHKDGLYIYFDFDAKPGIEKTLNNLFHVTDFVVRHMTVRYEEAPPPKVRTPKPASAPGAAPADKAPAPSPKPADKGESSPSK